MKREMDHIIKEKLQNRAVTAPKESWSVIESALHPEKKKRGVAWYLIPSFLLLALASLWWFTANQAEGVQVESGISFVEVETPEQISSEQTRLEQTVELRSDLSSQISAVDVASDKKTEVAPVVEINSSPKIGSTQEANSESRKNTVSSNRELNNTYKTIEAQSNLNTDIQASSFAKKNLDLTVGSTILTSTDDVNRNFTLEANQNKKSENVFGAQEKNSSFVSAINIALDRQNENKIENSTQKNLLMLSPLAIQEFNKLDAGSIELSKKLRKRMESPCYGKGPDCYDFKREGQPTALYAELLVGPDMVNRTLSSNSNELDYLNLRESSEVMEVSWSAALRGSVVLANGLAVRAGLHYSQIHERLDYEGRETRTREIEIGGVITSVVETGTVSRTIYNTLRTIDLPVMLGYELDMGKYILALNGGAAFNLNFTQEGQILQNNNTAVSINPNDINSIDIFNKNAGISALGSVGLYYKLSDKMQLMIEPSIRYRLGSVTKSTYAIDQKYMTVGLMAGLRLKLNK